MMEDDTSGILNACLLVCAMLFVTVGLILLNDRCVIQLPSITIASDTNGTPTLLEEYK